MYTDDIKINGAYNSGNKEGLSSLISICQYCEEWTYAWQIPVNISKTPVFHIGTLETAERSLNNYVLSSVSEVRDLGVHGS